MGGGALKVDAVHVRKVLFPKYSIEQIESLAQCGKKLTDMQVLSLELQDEIDNIVLNPFDLNNNDMLKRMRENLRRHLSERGAKL